EPNPRCHLADLCASFIVSRTKAIVPHPAGAVIVLTPSFDVMNFEAVQFEIGDGATDVIELAAGKNITRQRGEISALLAGARGAAFAWSRDGVIEKESTWL